MNCLYIKLILIFVLNVFTNIFDINCCFREDNKKIDNNDKNEYKEINIDDILNKLDKNIPDNFISSNKEPALKMIKVYNKDFKDEDIDIILQVIYNARIGKIVDDDVFRVIEAKIFKNKRNEHIVISINEDDKVYITCFNKCQYGDIMISPGVNVYEISYNGRMEGGGDNSVGDGFSEQILGKFNKILFDIFYEKNLKNGINLPLDIFYTITSFVGYFFTKNFYFEKDGYKNKINDLQNFKKATFNIKTNTLEKPIYIYLCNYTNVCYLVKNENSFGIINSNIDQLIVKISSEKVEIFKK